MFEMWPTSVFMPVDVTTNVPVPRVAFVFMKTMSVRSPSGTSSPSTGATPFETGRLSPVSADSATSRVAADRSRPSGGGMSPASTETMSPGTSCSAGSCRSSPSRCTFALMIIIFCRAATAAAALPSWFRPSTALKTVRKSSMIPVPYWPRGTMLPMPATRSTICIGSWYWRSKARQRGSAFASANLFGPYFCRRDAASAAVSPRTGSTSIEAATCSPGRSYHFPSEPLVAAAGATVSVIALSLLRAGCGRDLLRDGIGRDAFRRLGLELLLRDGERAARLLADRRVLRIDLGQRVHQHGGDGDPQEPLVVGGDHVPRRVLRARRGQHLRERRLVLVPVLALPDVVRVELPVLLRIVDPPEEPAALLLLREVQEQLHDREAVLDEEALPVVDLAVAPLPHAVVAGGGGQLLAGEDLRVDAHHEHLLVMRAVEDRDLASRRELLRVAPEEVVVELGGGRPAEAVDDDPLRVHAAHHVPDRAVLAARVERLERDEDAVGVLRGEARLVVVEEVDALLEQILALLLREEVAGVAGITVAPEDDLRAGRDAERLDELADPLNAGVCSHHLSNRACRQGR